MAGSKLNETGKTFWMATGVGEGCDPNAKFDLDGRIVLTFGECHDLTVRVTPDVGKVLWNRLGEALAEAEAAGHPAFSEPEEVDASVTIAEAGG